MAGASGICIFVVIYLFFDTKKFIQKKEKEIDNITQRKISSRNQAHVGGNNQTDLEYSQI